ncbi:hypothetical protein PR001_g22503 [Phytophthora rubi]|uniref:Uncharacterized protein n=1 Tax=Phytophthora rubi TaxID=129364 RepID=A0A6A3J3D4_9STRA|nr:hypothetical protein PR001_g22503 [Phytophthora rubi]
MEVAWEALQERYSSVEVALLATVSCLIGVLVWVLTRPIRDVGWAFAGEVWRVVKMNFSMSGDFLTRYQEVLRDPGVRSLRGPVYALALWGALLTVPGQVLEDKEDE